MTNLDDYFTKPTDSQHPRLRNWKARLSEPGTSATLEVYRPETEFGALQPEMNLQFTKDQKPQPLETLPWNDDLNVGLIQLGVRAVNQEQEAERFALGLRGALRKAEREFGDGYFNAVLLEFIKDSDFTNYNELAEVLRHAYAIPPYKEGRAYTLCREMIDGAIGERAHELTELLNYPQEEAKRILVSALARYLDQRFSVSNRRRMGLL
jgi:hypothetical protein